ncbi:HPr kinase/phosphorylase [Stappia sp.]|uniref:HPr kinase/phosphorylase n=1 Tax=Stappia sp. TaxID=1870903 RepID=UPI003A9A0995
MTHQAMHASCVLAGTSGVLLRGASGAGKSRLGRLIVEEAQARGRLGLHVADDRVHLRPRNGRLIASCPPPIAGLWELRGEGIVKVVCETCVVVRLVVDLLPEDEIERLPEAGDRVVRLLGIELVRLTLPSGGDGGAALRVMGELRSLEGAAFPPKAGASPGAEARL